ncbi:MAG: hypothetical protein LBF64_02240, partial [Oscillospiraceae bacterium]|nr:hypothetical protein [Oscillospiraceae bacterium]
RTYLYNNTIYSGPDHSVFSVVRGEPWDGKPKGTHFINNIFYIDGTVAEFGWAGDLRDKGKEGIVTYDHNLYCGKLFEGVPTWVAPATYNPNPSFLLPLRGNKVLRDMPDDKNAVFGDPRFVSPGGAGDGYESAAAYRIQEGSAALGAGALIDTSRLGQRLVEDYYNAQTPNKAVYFHILGDDFVWQDLNGKHDFFDNPLPVTLPPDIGAHQLSRALEATTALEETEAGVNARFAIYNRTEAAADLLCLYAVYDGAGRLADVHVRPVEGAALTDQEIEEAVGPVAPGHMVRAFVWKAAHEIFVALARAV